MRKSVRWLRLVFNWVLRYFAVWAPIVAIFAVLAAIGCLPISGEQRVRFSGLSLALL